MSAPDAQCKACGNPLVEGRAFELGSHRWHLHCFRCSKCNKQLTANSNMLVLGDGTPVCAECSYTCSFCSKKITDMAVLTSDNAFCSDCLFCRNCKKRINDLQYARTSQGIFCMNCHNALLARKRQRQQMRQQLQGTPQDTPQRLASPAGEGSLSSSNSLVTIANSIESATYDRNKELPQLPHEIPISSVDTKIDFSSLKPENVKPEYVGDTSATSSTLSLKSSSRVNRVPRKQLAPSAFQHSEASLLADVGSSSLEEPLDTPDDSETNISTEANGSNSTATCTDSTTGSTESKTEAGLETPRRNDRSTDRMADRSTETPTNLSVPQRSQLRPNSPTRFIMRSPSLVPGDSPHVPRVASYGNIVTAVMPPQPLDGTANGTTNGTSSPTQAAAPATTPKSPFNRWWHKRDHSAGNLSSIEASNIGSIPPTPEQNEIVGTHKRSFSENLATLLKPSSSGSNSDGSTSSDTGTSAELTVSDLTVALSLERERTAKLEAMLKRADAQLKSKEQLKQLVVERDGLRTELADLQLGIKKAQDEYKLLMSRNTQLNDMNVQLEKHTLEKFGPKSLWGSQNSSANSPIEKDRNALSLNRLDSDGSSQPPKPGQRLPQQQLPQPQYSKDSNSNGSNGSSTLQAQFLPLKNARQWFRRPNKPGQNQQQQQTNGNNSYLSNNYSTVLSGQTANIYARQPPYADGKPDQIPANSIIGESLSFRTHVDQAEVPLFVTRCFREVEARGLDTEGVYRKPGSKSQIDAILEQFGPAGDCEHGEELLVKSEIQAVTSAVKQYIRKLAEPVITYDCYEAFIAAGNSHNVSYLNKVINNLPRANQATLKTVILHLALVATHDSHNLMNIKNLAMVFAPTLAREETGSREVEDMQARDEATQMLIVNAATLFEPHDELL